jgi:collagenase-like PrtC family protease
MVRVKVVGSIGSPLQVIMTSGVHSVVGETDGLLQQAEGSGMDPDKVRKAIGTKPFEGEWAIAGDIDLSGLDQAAWCPLSWIKEARRRAVHSWEELHATLLERQKEADRELNKAPLVQGAPLRLLQNSVSRLVEDISEATATTSLSVLCRNLDQVEAICKLIESGDDSGNVDEIVIDFLEVDGMRDAMTRIRATPKRITAVVASPRILKPEEGGIWKSLLSLEPDALLIRSTGLLHRMRTLGSAPVNVGTASKEHWVAVPTLLGDFSLNAANALTVAELLSAGLERVTASYDLNANSIAQMGQLLGPSLSSKLEVVVHCKMPIFHTEHCVFARFLTKGDSYLDCGHACTRNTIHLRDERTGLDNLVLADMGCRNTVFSAQAQSGVHSLKQWQAAGIRRFRIELVDEDPEGSAEVVRAYSDCLAGYIKASAVWDQLQDIPDSNGRSSGVSLGSFRNNQERRAGEIAN